MAGPPLARLRVELEADSASLETGLKDAGAALQRFAAAGVAAGNLIVAALGAVANAVASRMNDILEPTGRIFQELSQQGVRAALLINRSFAEMGERATQFQVALTERVLPGVAAVVERLANLQSTGVLVSFAVEGLVVVLKSLASTGAIVVGVFDAIGVVVTRVAQAILQVAKGEFTEAVNTLKAGLNDLSRSAAATGEQLVDIWRETAIEAQRVGVAGKIGDKEVADAAEREAREAARRTREAVREGVAAWDEWRAARDRALMETISQQMADPTVAIEDRLASIQAAYDATAISGTRAAQLTQRAWLINQKAMEGSLQAVGRALSALFPKSKAAAIGEALINTYVGITQALRAGPPPWNMIQAAAVGAMGFAQVRAITSTSENGGGGGAAAAAPVAEAPSAAPSQTLTVQGLSGTGLVSMMEMRDLAERLLAYQADGGRVVIA